MVGCDARDARKGGRETSRRWARSGEGFPRTHRVQPDGGALVVDARDGARAPFAPSALPGVVLALAKHLHGQARPVNQESRAAAGDLGLGLVLALPRLGLLRGNREERRQISRASRGRSTRARRRVRRLTVTMEKERYSGDSTAPRGGGCAEGREGGRRAPGNPCVRRRCSPGRWILLVGERGEWRVSRRARALARERPLRAGVRRGCSLASDFQRTPTRKKGRGRGTRARRGARAGKRRVAGEGRAGYLNAARTSPCTRARSWRLGEQGRRGRKGQRGTVAQLQGEGEARCILFFKDRGASLRAAGGARTFRELADDGIRRGGTSELRQTAAADSLDDVGHLQRAFEGEGSSQHLAVDDFLLLQRDEQLGERREGCARG